PDGEHEALDPDGRVGLADDRLRATHGIDSHRRTEDPVRVAQGAQGPDGQEVWIAGSHPDADERASHDSSPGARFACAVCGVWLPVYPVTVAVAPDSHRLPAPGGGRHCTHEPLGDVRTRRQVEMEIAGEHAAGGEACRAGAEA